jgi:Tfp pilus assembly protein PilX
MRRIAPRRVARGFSLLVTLFVILVLAALAAFAVRIGATQAQSEDFDLLNARAQAAAASGIEYGANQALRAASCVPSTTLNLGAAGLSGFSVTVTCSASMHTVSGMSYESYLLTATAQHGLYGNPDFVQASETRSVNNAPP